MAEVKQAVILAGGRGERLRPITDSVPKPMAPVGEIPYLRYLMKTITDVGIQKVLLLVGYKHEVIIDHFTQNPISGLTIEYSIGKEEDETGKRVLQAYEQLEDHFLLLYGDNYWPIEFDSMLSLYNQKQAGVSTTVFSNKNGTAEYGPENNVEVGTDNVVKRYDKSRSSNGLNGVDIGYFLVAKNVLPKQMDGNPSFERDILPEFIAKQELVAYVTDRQYYYITNLECLDKFSQLVKTEGLQAL